MIIGWQGLIDHTGLKEMFLRRAIAYYGFPKAKRDHRVGKSLFYAWNKEEVDCWLKNNKGGSNGRERADS